MTHAEHLHAEHLHAEHQFVVHPRVEHQPVEHQFVVQLHVELQFAVVLLHAISHVLSLAHSSADLRRLILK